MYSYRIELAIRAATVLHQNQVRKGEMRFPYVSHPVAVAFILMDYTDSEDVIIAALLHDTVEDTDYTLDELQADFGGNVRELVESVTEPDVNDSSRGDWKKRKHAYLKKLKRASVESVMIAAADKIHNMRTVVEAYYGNPTRFKRDFGDVMKERIDHYQALANLINRRLESDIRSEFNHVFQEYQQFVIELDSSSDSL